MTHHMCTWVVLLCYILMDSKLIEKQCGRQRQDQLWQVDQSSLLLVSSCLAWSLSSIYSNTAALCPNETQTTHLVQVYMTNDLSPAAFSLHNQSKDLFSVQLYSPAHLNALLHSLSPSPMTTLSLNVSFLLCMLSHTS
jgi:hypothetical protein